MGGARRRGRAARRIAVVTTVVATTVAGAIVTWPGRPAAVASPSTLYVAIGGRDLGNGCTSAADPCATIGNALGNAPSGATIDVGAGTFDEKQLVVWNPVTIVGAGAGRTVLDIGEANPDCTGDGFIQHPDIQIGHDSSGNCAMPSDASGAQPVGAYALDAVTVEGTGGALTGGNPQDQGLPDAPDLVVSDLAGASTLTLSGDEFATDTTLDPYVESDSSVGVLVGGAPGSSTSIVDSTFTGMWQAVLAYGYSGALSISQSAFSGLVPLEMTEAVATASGVPWDPAPGATTEPFAPEGVLSMNPGSSGGQQGVGTFEVTGTSFTGYDGDGVIAEAGQGYLGRPGGVEGVTISGDTFDLGVAPDSIAGPSQPITIDADAGSTTSDVAVTDDVVTTTGPGSAAIGLTVAPSASASQAGAIDSVTISGDTLTATGDGASDVLLEDLPGGAPGDASGTIDALSITDDSLAGPGGVAVAGPVVSSISATDDYWGTPSGPSEQGTVAGATVAPGIAISPWWTTPDGLPGAPTILGVVTTATSATLEWRAPALTGSSTGTILSYTISASPATGGSVTVPGTSSRATLTSLLRGTTYRLAVSAAASGGDGPAAVSVPVTLDEPAAGTSAPGTSAPPAAPTATVVTRPPATSPATTLPVSGGAVLGVPAAALAAPTTGVVQPVGATTVTARSGAGTADVSVPAGALAPGTTVAVYPAARPSTIAVLLPRGDAYVVSFAVGWFAAAGGTAVSTGPVTITITDDHIRAGDAVYELTGSGARVVGVSKANGTATATFRGDPTFVVAATPDLVISSPAVQLGGGRAYLAVRCRGTAPCSGSAVLSIARVSRTGTVLHVVVARGRFSLAPSRSRSIAMWMTAPGRVLAARARSGHRTTVTLVTRLSSGARAVRRVALVR